MPLDIGIFSISISTVDTEVSYQIQSNYIVDAKFVSHGVEYVFHMKKWRKTNEGTKNPLSTFFAFARLMFDKYGDIVPDNLFGKTSKQTKEDGTEIFVFIPELMSDAEKINMLRYAMIEVFICAEQIILSHKRSLLDYCIYFREKELCDTYEHYIHLVACHCLVHSNYFAPGIQYVPVGFYTVSRKFDNEILQKTVVTAEPMEEEEDTKSD